MAQNRQEQQEQQPQTFVIDDGSGEQLTGTIDAETKQRMIDGLNAAIVSMQSDMQTAATAAIKEAASVSVWDTISNTMKTIQDAFAEAAKTRQLLIESLQPAAETWRSIAAAFNSDEWKKTIAGVAKTMQGVAEIFEKLQESGILDRMEAVATKLQEMGFEETEPADCLYIINEAVITGENNSESVIDLLPLLAQQLEGLRQKAGCEQVTIYDLLRCYGGGDATPEQAAAVKKARAQLIKKPAQQRAQRAHKAAENAGAIMTLGGRLGSFSQENFWDVFTSNIIAAMPDEVRGNALFDNGKLVMYSLNGQPLQPVESINGAALMAICKAVFDTDMREYGDGNFTVALYLPAICKELGIDPRSATDSRRGKNAFKKQREKAVSETGTALTWSEQRTATMEKLLKPFDPDVARATDGSYYRLCVIEQYDAEKELLYVSSPFFFKLREIIALQADRHSALTTLFHADVANERNWAAVELANRILAGIVRRGITRPDSKTYKNNDSAVSRRTVTKTAADGTKTTITEQFQPTQQPAEETAAKKEKVFTWSDSFKSLIDECPQLQHELAEIENHADKDETGKVYHRAQAYNAKLKQTFAAAYRIILEKTDAPKYYKGLRIEPTNAKGEIVTPTKSTLRSSITIRHNGKNPEYSE